MSTRHGPWGHPAREGHDGAGAGAGPESETEKLPAVAEQARRPVPWGWIATGVVGLALAGNGIVAAGLPGARSIPAALPRGPAPVAVTASLVPQGVEPGIALAPSSPATDVAPSPTPTPTPAAPTRTRRPERAVLPRATPTRTSTRTSTSTQTPTSGRASGPASGFTPRHSTTVTPIPSAHAACAVTYRVQSEWNRGYVAQLRITNTGTRPLHGWTLTFSLPRGQGQVITNGWGAQFNQSRDRVGAAAASYNTDLAVNATATAGFQAAFSGGGAGQASGFTLNGATCSVS